MKAIVTGASSGIGRDISRYLDTLGYDLVLVARNTVQLKEVAKELKGKTEIVTLDLSKENNCNKLYDMYENDKIDILVNNAGFGLFGKFNDTDIYKELDMIDLNIKAVHILSKLFLKNMKKRNSGYILNVASAAAFQPGPLMATYYATKAYVLRLTTALYEELKRDNSQVVVSVLCPGPVSTNFSKVANVDFSMKPLKSSYVAKYAIDQMFKKKLIIIPGWYMKIAYYIGRIVPTKLILQMTYNIQKNKKK